jgi:crotonobetainyl-CoA:carnitine CoA-transferase CaiB-like acyl-CoA transferase
VAAPLATRHLADMGARVIKIERPGEGDFGRRYDDVVRGLASHFVWLNRGKESLCIDLKSPLGVGVVRRVIDRADVFVQNLAPGAAERLGLGAAELRSARPELIVAAISGFGTSGPRREEKAYDMIVQAESGAISVTGTPEHPAKTGIPAADIAAGMYAVTGILGALVRSARSGAGATVEVSMFDAITEWLGHQMYVQLYGGQQAPRMGIAHPAIVPYDAYPTRDGDLLIGVQNDRGWRALAADVLGRPDLAEDPRFATNILRVRHRQECDAAVARETRQWEREPLMRRLAQAGVPAGRLNGIAELVDHPQLAERDRWRTVLTERGEVSALLPPFDFDGAEAAMGDVPALGAHTDAVLTEIGVSAAELAKLHRHGVVHQSGKARAA